LNQSRTVFAQLIQFLSHNEFNRCVARYGGNKSVRSFSCWDQFLTMAFAQLTYRESLRDIEVCLAAQQRKLYHSGFSGPVKRATLADANENRDWRIYRDFAHSLIQIARPLYAHSDLGLELAATAYAFDATTIDLCLSLFPWAKFRERKGAIKLHTLLEIHSAIPVFIAITAGDVHEVNLLDELTLEPGSFIVMDRGFVDFQRLHRLHTALAFFVIRSKGNLAFRRRYSHPHDRTTGVRSDQTIILTGPLTSRRYPLALRRVHYYSALANRTVLQMDQATSAHQKLFRYFRQQCEDPNLGRRYRLRTSCYCQKALGAQARSLHFVTDSESYSFRENPHFKPASAVAIQS
jgi:hypothetical protein